MIFLYNLSIQLYYFLVWFASFFKDKAKKWYVGRKNIFQTLENQLEGNAAPIIWFHAASLGEFEQARPIIEAIKIENPPFDSKNPKSETQNQKSFKILLTFFSPSGYEVRKDYESADYVFYLPLDTPQNAQKFLNMVKPAAVFWVKYEFWYHYLRAIQNRQIPLILFSAVFRENQFFFKWYGKAFLNLLKGFTQIFVQNEQSYNLLKIKGLQNVQIAGDTRFDRVSATVQNVQSFPIVEQFKNHNKLLIIGSSWSEDLAVLLPFLNGFKFPLKVIIAPHEIQENKLQVLENQLVKKSIRYSQVQNIKPEELKTFEVLLIDNVGMLASLYQSGEFAYIGGAFQQGLHNILEPATFGMPVIFGKKYHKNPEAQDLIALGGAFSIQNSAEFELLFERLYQNDEQRQAAGNICRTYIAQNIGGATKVWDYFQKNISI
ncbi:MAG: 3-deoxy-D-manno-octulosonic acid transferase [Microscillaceae bacterium]|jgi:3-deoxy-D-manno-octulosonic-acid transferase|nr:3-deoxy-D-manno-octulosonic acid transferase [Microscillaceae bacterium]